MGETPLYVAVATNQIGIVRTLLGLPTIDVNLATNQKVTPLYIAAKNKFIDICELLVSRDDIKENIATEVGVTPFMAASKKGEYDLVYVLYQGVRKLPLAENRAEVRFDRIAPHPSSSPFGKATLTSSGCSSWIEPLTLRAWTVRETRS
jgi:hypothetical protein